MAPPSQGGDRRTVMLLNAGARQNTGFGRMNNQTPAYGKPGTMTAASHKLSVAQFASTTEQSFYHPNPPRGGRAPQRQPIEDVTPAKPQNAKIQVLEEVQVGQDAGEFANNPTATYDTKLPNRGRNVDAAEAFLTDKDSDQRGQGVRGGRDARTPKPPQMASQYHNTQGDYEDDADQADPTDDQAYDVAEDYQEPPAATDNTDPTVPFDNSDSSPAFLQNRNLWENTCGAGPQATATGHPHDNQADFSDGSEATHYRVGGAIPGSQVSANPATRNMARQDRQHRGSPFDESRVDIDFSQHHHHQYSNQPRQVDYFPFKSSNHGHPQHFKSDPNDMLRTGQQPCGQRHQGRVNQQHAGQQINERGGPPPHSSRHEGHPNTYPSRLGGRQPTHGNQTAPGGSRSLASQAAPSVSAPQFRFFSGQTFPTFITPVQGLNMKALWEKAIKEVKAEHKKAVAEGMDGLNSNEIFDALSTYNDKTTDAIQDMGDFLHQVQNQQMELKSAVDVSVQKLRYKTSLYDKARREAMTNAYNAKIWEPKRARIA